MSYAGQTELGRSRWDRLQALSLTERIVVGIAIVNFVLFVLIAVWLGGDAINGTVRDGHYFLASHGHFTEVNRGVFAYSKIHTLSLLVTHPAGIIVLIIARFRDDPSRASPPAL